VQEELRGFENPINPNSADMLLRAEKDERGAPRSKGRRDSGKQGELRRAADTLPQEVVERGHETLGALLAVLWEQSALGFKIHLRECGRAPGGPPRRELEVILLHETQEQSASKQKITQ
jgi:hypothetical protein